LPIWVPVWVPIWVTGWAGLAVWPPFPKRVAFLSVGDGRFNTHTQVW
jgi:hypothetical protein